MSKDKKIKITIIYDNTAFNKTLVPDWGFSCLVEAYGKKILFDTGAKSRILFNNMKKLQLNLSEIDMIFISHDHWDHTGGLLDILKKNQVKVYIPEPCNISGDNIYIVKGKKSYEICKNVYSTGTMKNIEHSLVINDEGKLTIITGCSHPGVSEILKAASYIGNVAHLIGGLHGFNEFEMIKDLKSVCPTHCTSHIKEIKKIYPDKYIQGGAGRIIKI